MKIILEIPNILKVGQQYWEIYMKTSVRILVACDIKSPHKSSLQC